MQRRGRGQPARRPDASRRGRSRSTRDELAALARPAERRGGRAAQLFETRVYVGARRATGARSIGVPRLRAPARRRRPRGVRLGAAATARSSPKCRTRARTATRAGAGDVARVIAADGSVRALRISGEGRNLDGGAGRRRRRQRSCSTRRRRTVAALSGEPGLQLARVPPAGPRRRGGRGDDRRGAAAICAAVPGFARLRRRCPAVRAPGDWPGKQEFEDFSHAASTSSRSWRCCRRSC